MTKRMTGGRYIAEMFKAYDISHVFYVDAILRSTLVEMDELGLKYVLTHSEKAAAYMADGFARARRGPGVCMAQSVGAANLAAGLQDACFAQTPVVAITGRHQQKNQYKNFYQELPHQPMFAPFTKFSGIADDIDQYAHVFRTAWRSALAGRGPSHFDVGGHLGDPTALKEYDFDIIREEKLSRNPAFRPGATSEDLDELAAAINKAERPLIVLGVGAMHSDPGKALTALVDKISAGVVSSLDGKNILFEGHELNGRIVGTYSCQSANKMMAEADLVIFAGTKAGDQVTNNFTLVSPHATVFQIDHDPMELGRNFPLASYLQSDIARCFEEVIGRVTANRREPWRAFIKGAVTDWVTKADALKSAASMPMRPERLCLEIEKVLPANALLVADTGLSSQWSGTLIDMTSPDQRYLRAAGSLGWGFPAALGAKAAVGKERPVVCFTGDAGFLYHLPEMETAVRHGLNTVTVVNNNRAIAQGLTSMNNTFKGRGKVSNAYAFNPVDYAAAAEAFGCFGASVDTPEQFPEVFKAALAANKPAIIEVFTDMTAQPDPAWKPSQA